MAERQVVCQKKKGYLKIHVAVNVKTKEILALEVTDEKVHDGKMMGNWLTACLEKKQDCQHQNRFRRRGL